MSSVASRRAAHISSSSSVFGTASGIFQRERGWFGGYRSWIEGQIEVLWECFGCTVPGDQCCRSSVSRSSPTMQQSIFIFTRPTRVDEPKHKLHLPFTPLQECWNAKACMATCVAVWLDSANVTSIILYVARCCPCTIHGSGTSG